jgi:5-methylthioadenosine/S-adenosylhomocysteine deaminase
VEPIDLIIEPTWVIPVEPAGCVLEGHAVAVHEGAIVAVLPTAESAVRFAPRERVRLEDHALIPGLINAHVHNPMTLLRGLADDTPLMVWLENHIWPVEARWVGETFVRDGAELAIAEMLRSGTTCCSELYFFPDVLAATYREAGFRAVVGLPVVEFPTAWAEGAGECLDKGMRVHSDYRGDRLITTALGPHAPYTVSDESLLRVRALAEQHDLLVHMHVHESAREVEDATRASGVRPLERLRRLGLVDARLMAVHMTQLTEDEIALAAESGLTVVHCPESNLKLASGLCPAARLARAGARVILGTDGPASNNDLDMLGEMRTAALLAKGVSGDAAALGAVEALRMATIDAARALRIDDRVGSIEVGKRADLVAVDLSFPETTPVYDPTSQIVYAAGRGQVREVWLDGRRRLREGALVDLDLDAILERARAWRHRILGAASP